MKNKKGGSEKYEIGDDATQYGEFITTYFAWVPPAIQKDKVERLENISKRDQK